MKKFFISLIIITLFAGFIFFVGWVQFAVPIGEYGVMVSKTGGVNSQTIIPGSFRWQWESIFPTNVKLYTFTLKPQSYTKTLTGNLPSAEVYTQMTAGRPDFSYSIFVSLSLSLQPQALPQLVKNQNVTDQAGLTEYISLQAEQVAMQAVQLLLSSTMQNPFDTVLLSVDSQKLLTMLQDQSRFSQLHIEDVQVTINKIPDMVVYNLSKNAYMAYQEQTQKELTEAAKKQSITAANTFFELDLFANLGRILEQYPSLLNSQGALPALDAMRIK